MESITQKIIVITAILAIAVGSAVIALDAYAHGGGTTTQPATNTYGRQYGPMGGMMGSGMMGGGMMGTGMQNQGGGMMGGYSESYTESYDENMAEYCPGMEMMEEYMEEYYQRMHEGYQAGNLTTITGQVVGIDPQRNALIVVDEHNEAHPVIILPMYVDNSTGYLVSGFWIVNQVASILANGGMVNATAQVPGTIGYMGNGGLVAFNLNILGMDLVSQMYYMHP